MPQLATDNFNRADSGTLGASWTVLSGMGAIRIVSNAAAPDGDPQGEWNNTVTWPANQWAQITLKTPIATGSGKGMGVMIRASNSAETAYLAFGNSAGLELYKVVAGTFTQIGTSATVPVNNDVLYLEARGTAIKVYLNGVSKISVTDSSISTGRAGVFAADDGSAPKGDDWSGGSFFVGNRRTGISLGTRVGCRQMGG